MPNEQKVVGILGRAGAGKDTLADFFVDCGYRNIAVADPIKEIAWLLYGIPENELWGPSQDKTERSRKAMQMIGTGIRNEDPDVWIETLCKRVMLHAPLPIVIPDLRLPLEVHAIKTRFPGSLILKLDRAYTNKYGADHVTETSIDEVYQPYIDYVLSNTGELDDLKAMFSYVMEAYDAEAFSRTA